MSFILDALKKSEIERQRQTVPGLVDSGIARPQPRIPMWAVALFILLGITLIVLLFVLTRGWMAASHAPQAQATTQIPRVDGPAAPDDSRASTGSKVSAPAAVDGHFSPLDAPTVYAPEIPVTTADNAATAPTPVIRRPTVNSGSSGTHPIHRRDPVLNDEDYKADDDEVLPSINEINLTGEQALPELHLDVHVFATKSAERFVFINMRKYHEGATLQEGPTVERIRRDGVILDYQGLRFLVPRQ
jgi:general secretion pathway protein B